MKKYEVSLGQTHYTSKPAGSEIGKVSNGLYTKSINFKKLVYEAGERGCTFSPAVYDGKRRKENYLGQQLTALDFDNGVTFAEIRQRAERYRLPILFAYKTFSYTEEHEKFRVIFALSDIIINSFASEIKKFYQSLGIKYDKILPVVEDGKLFMRE